MSFKERLDALASEYEELLAENERLRAHCCLVIQRELSDPRGNRPLLGFDPNKLHGTAHEPGLKVQDTPPPELADVALEREPFPITALPCWQTPGDTEAPMLRSATDGDQAPRPVLADLTLEHEPCPNITPPCRGAPSGESSPCASDHAITLPWRRKISEGSAGTQNASSVSALDRARPSSATSDYTLVNRDSKDPRWSSASSKEELQLQHRGEGCAPKRNHRSSRDSRLSVRSGMTHSGETRRSRTNRRASEVHDVPPELPRLSDRRRTECALFEDQIMAVGHTRNPAARHYGTFKMMVHRLLKDQRFDMMITVCICVDCVVVAIDTQDSLTNFITNRTPVAVISTIINVVFMLELFLRFFAYGVVQALKVSGWVRFDAVFVFATVVELLLIAFISDAETLASFGLLRLLRCMRLSRAARLTIQFRTLWLLVSGLKNSLPTILWTMILTGCISFMYAILGMETIPPRDLATDTEFNDIASTNFGNLAAAMLTLLQVLTLDSVGGIYRPLIESGSVYHSILCTVYFVSFILINSIALMNLVTAVIVEGSLQQAAQDKDVMRQFERRRQEALMPKLRQIFQSLDEDGSGSITLDEIDAAPDEIQEELRKMTQQDDLAEIFALIDDDDSGFVNIDEFLDGVMKASSGDLMLNLQMAKVSKQVRKVKTAVLDADSAMLTEFRAEVQSVRKALEGIVQMSRNPKTTHPRLTHVDIDCTEHANCSKQPASIHQHAAPAATSNGHHL